MDKRSEYSPSAKGWAAAGTDISNRLTASATNWTSGIVNKLRVSLVILGSRDIIIEYHGHRLPQRTLWPIFHPAKNINFRPPRHTYTRTDWSGHYTNHVPITRKFTFLSPPLTAVVVLSSSKGAYVIIRFSIDSSRLIRGKAPSSRIWDNSNSGSPVGLLFDFLHCCEPWVESWPCFVNASARGTGHVNGNEVSHGITTTTQSPTVATYTQWLGITQRLVCGGTRISQGPGETVHLTMRHRNEWNRDFNRPADNAGINIAGSIEGKVPASVASSSHSNAIDGTMYIYEFRMVSPWDVYNQ